MRYYGPDQDSFANPDDFSVIPVGADFDPNVNEGDFGTDRWNYRGYLRWENDEGITVDLIAEVGRDKSSAVAQHTSAPGLLYASNGTPVGGAFPLPFLDQIPGIEPILDLLPDGIIGPNGDSLNLPFTFLLADCIRFNGQCVSVDLGTGPLGLGFDSPGYYTGNLPDEAYNVTWNAHEPSEINIETFVIDSVWESEFGDFFLNAGFRRQDNISFYSDIDNSAYDVYSLTPRREEHEQTTLEFRYSNQLTDTFSLTTGLFYINQEYKMAQTFSGSYIYLFSGLLFSFDRGDEPLQSVYSMTDAVEQDQKSLAFLYLSRSD